MTESEILALIDRSIDSLKQGRKELLSSNRTADYQLYSIETMVECTRTISIKIETLEFLFAQIVAGDPM